VKCARGAKDGTYVTSEIGETGGVSEPGVSGSTGRPSEELRSPCKNSASSSEEGRSESSSATDRCLTSGTPSSSTEGCSDAGSSSQAAAEAGGSTESVGLSLRRAPPFAWSFQPLL